MRRIQRVDISGETRRDLLRRQRQCANAAEARTRWDNYRAAAASAPVRDALVRMAGRRWRCYYCSDSRGSDIDHFVPISQEYGRTFDWYNHQWSCTDCNRRKSRRHIVDDLGAPLLLSPTRDDPWAHFGLDTRTGVIAGRQVGGEIDVRAAATLDIVAPLAHEAVSETRLRAIRELRACVEAVVVTDGEGQYTSRLLRCVNEDDTGVSDWFFRWEGRSEEPFADLRALMPRLWRHCVLAATKH